MLNRAETAFEDRFSSQAAQYALFRPRYPSALYDFVAELAPDRALAWDCGAGNGQATGEIAARFSSTVATDASAEQVRQAVAIPGVVFRVATAESSGLQDRSVSLVAVASALHWFDLPRFYTEVRRVARPGAVLAAWGYRECTVSTAIDALLDRYQNGILSGYWAPNIKLVASRYQDIPFPFEEIPAPAFEAVAEMTVDQMLGYLNTWSASRAYAERNGYPATRQIEQELRVAWHDRSSGASPLTRPVRWPLFTRVGRVL